MKYVISPSKLIALSFFLPSLFALLLIVVLEYWFGYHPCTLCIYERWSYFITMLTAMTLFFLEESNPFLVFFAITSLLSGTAVTLYHIGVESHIFTVEESCTIIYNNAHNIGNLYEQLATNEIVRCDAPKKLGGVYLTHLNLIYSLVSTFTGIFVYKRNANRSAN